MKTNKLVKKCECGYEIYPFASSLIDNAWLDKKDIAHFGFKCPSCTKDNVIKLDWK